MKNEMNPQETNSKVILDQRPTTWPEEGKIDLDIHDLPHRGAIIEWWYQNCHVTSKDGDRFSLFASFFRLASKKDEESDDYSYAHFIIWALSDKVNQKYYTDSLVDPSMPAESLKVLNKKEETINKQFYRALKEVYAKGNVPFPDRLLKEPANVALDNLLLEYDQNSFKKDEQGNYHLLLDNPLDQIECKLEFTPLIEPVRHGNEGELYGIWKEDMFYYFIPKCKVSGEILIQNKTYKVEGSGWYDHEFSKSGDETAVKDFRHDMSWDWISLQLDNGFQMSLYDLFDNTKNGEYAGGTGIIIDKNGKRISVEDYTFEPVKHWTSARTFITYPVAWELEIPSFNVSLFVEVDFPEQEFITTLSMPAFWEGSIKAEGNFMGVKVTGVGYSERTGFNTKESIESFLKGVGKCTQEVVESLLPLNPTQEQFHKLVNSPVGVDFFSEADKEQYITSVIKPIREIVDRSKKAWRSYVLLACIDAVGGNSQPFIDILAMPELVHSGSLIVDDVQDSSDTRRGGTSLHHLYGEPLAINAGNTCYFLGDLVVKKSLISDDVRLRIYELYFEMMRAAHAGQGLDISGLHSLMPDAVKNGDSSILEKRIYSIHRLKTAAPACTLAKIGGIMGGGKPQEIEALANYFEAIGLAYQIVDDVLNLEGYENNLKDKGEDITAGKITMPVAKAMGLLTLDKREYIWKTIQTMPKDTAVIASVIKLLEECGALKQCRIEAENLMEEAWKEVEKIIPDSFYKIRLRAFGWFALKIEC
ncbi:polyprenyl synthetase family protein [Flavobacterium sp.]|uniref:polyprenyl synthetase family protein n=1 Tax=Flavobacterium sp. TaxID=239 RepID=UPI0031D9764E